MQSPFCDTLTSDWHKNPKIASLLAIIVVTMGVLIAARLDSPFSFDVDSHNYVDLAEGRIRAVVKPFTNRVLHPWIAGTVARTFQLSTDLSFLIVGILALIILVTTVTLIARSFVPHFLIPAILATPFLVDLFQDYYLPDLFHAALLGFFFLCLFHKKYWISLVVLFLLQMTRESTLLLAFIFILLTLSKGRWKISLGAITSTLLGIAVTNHLASLGQPNIHQMNDFLYLAAKVPYNFFKNTLGLIFWTDTFAINNPVKFPLEPLWQISLPEWVPSGAIHSVGFYAFDHSYPLITANLLLTTFGILPTLVLANLVRLRKQFFLESEIYLTTALLYGLLSFIIGPALGASVNRLIGYGWPCFWIALPALLHKYQQTDRKFYVKILAIHLLAAWFPFLLGVFSSRSALLSIPVLCLSLALQGITWREIQRSKFDPERIPEAE